MGGRKVERESRGQLTTGSEDYYKDYYKDFECHDILTSRDRVGLCWVVSSAEEQHPPDTEGEARQAAAAKTCTHAVER